MIEQTPWMQREFNLGFPIGLFPCILERLRGTPARLEELAAQFPPDVLTKRVGNKWSIQEHVGHLLDLCELDDLRLMDYLAKAETLTAADMGNRKTQSADHNAKAIKNLLGSFRSRRLALVRKLEHLNDTELSRSAVHPRLQKPMGVVDWVYFMSEHDDHHIARITSLGRVR